MICFDPEHLWLCDIHGLSLSERICVSGTTWHINKITVVTCLRLTVLQSVNYWGSASVTGAVPLDGSSFSLLHDSCLEEQLASTTMLKQSSFDMNKGLDTVQFQKSLEEVKREKEC